MDGGAPEDPHLVLILQHLLVMNLKQPWVTIAVVLLMFAVLLPGVRADSQANCSAGWEWVRSICEAPSLPLHEAERASSVLIYGIHSL